VNVVQIKLFSVGFFWIVLRFVLLGSKFFLSEKSVTVNGDFAVRCHHYSLFGKYKWVNLNHVAVFLHEAFVELLEEMDYLRSLSFEPKILSCLNAIRLLKSLQWVHS
jgi:hypothetical protein